MAPLVVIIGTPRLRVIFLNHQLVAYVRLLVLVFRGIDERVVDRRCIVG
jgi:hypothetical protein